MINLRLAAAAIAMLITAPAIAAEYRVIETCPPELDYCLRVSKPVLSQLEVLAREADAIAAGAKTAREEEARKTQVRHEANYRDPGAVNLCPAPHYRMTVMDGCQPARR